MTVVRTFDKIISPGATFVENNCRYLNFIEVAHLCEFKRNKFPSTVFSPSNIDSYLRIRLCI